MKTVPFGATPSIDPAPVEEWANAAVWNERMLTSLRNGVRGGKWHTFSDKVFQRESLLDAARRVVVKEGAAGVDHITTEAFQERLVEEIPKLRDALQDDSFRPQAIRRGGRYLQQ